MGRRQTDSELGRCTLQILLLMGTISCCMVYVCLSMIFHKPSSIAIVSSASNIVEDGGQEEGECCRGIKHLELWGDAVKWGSQFKVNSSEECCMACKGMCGGEDGPCLCDSWVYCADREACGPRFGELTCEQCKNVEM
uniref:Apple domain-containing protein n=1 Tax=Fagus sylvatica TaxID=28930 RepID=A0A2N9ET65_FAGSY